MNKQTSCQSDQAILVQIEEYYYKIRSLTRWQKSLLSSCIDTQWLAGYFGCFTSPNLFFSHDCKCWATSFLCPQYRVVGLIFFVWFIIRCLNYFFPWWLKWMCHCHLGTSNKKHEREHVQCCEQGQIFLDLCLLALPDLFQSFFPRPHFLLQTSTPCWEFRSGCARSDFHFN